MNKRTFLQRLLGIGGAAVLVPSAFSQQPPSKPEHTPSGAMPEPGKRVTLLRTFVAGYQYHKGHLIEDELVVQTPLKLVPEIDNKHSQVAVAIYYDTYQIGYVPEGMNTVLHEMLVQGVEVQCEIAQVLTDFAPWERVMFEAYLPAGVPLEIKGRAYDDLDG